MPFNLNTIGFPKSCKSVMISSNCLACVSYDQYCQDTSSGLSFYLFRKCHKTVAITPDALKTNHLFHLILFIGYRVNFIVSNDALVQFCSNLGNFLCCIVKHY